MLVEEIRHLVADCLLRAYVSLADIYVILRTGQRLEHTIPQMLQTRDLDDLDKQVCSAPRKIDIVHEH